VYDVEKGLPSVLRTGKKFTGPNAEYANGRRFNNEIGLKRSKWISENKTFKSRLSRVDELQSPLRHKPRTVADAFFERPEVPMNVGRERALLNARRPLDTKIRSNNHFITAHQTVADRNKKIVRDVLRTDERNKIKAKAEAKAQAEAAALAAKKKKDFQRKVTIGAATGGVVGAGTLAYRKHSQSSVSKAFVDSCVSKGTNFKDYENLPENVRSWTDKGPFIRRNPVSPTDMLSSGMMMAEAQAAGMGRNLTRRERKRMGNNVKNYGEGRMFMYSPISRGSIMT